jgi:hypothetical protein
MAAPTRLVVCGASVLLLGCYATSMQHDVVCAQRADAAGDSREREPPTNASLP